MCDVGACDLGPLLNSAGLSDTSGVVWFYSRGPAKRSIETRLALEGDGYELVIDDGLKRVESFPDLPTLLTREHELRDAWKAQGWREVGE